MKVKIICDKNFFKNAIICVMVASILGIMLGVVVGSILFNLIG